MLDKNIHSTLISLLNTAGMPNLMISIEELRERHTLEGEVFCENSAFILGDKAREDTTCHRGS